MNKQYYWTTLLAWGLAMALCLFCFLYIPELKSLAAISAGMIGVNFPRRPVIRDSTPSRPPCGPPT